MFGKEKKEKRFEIVYEQGSLTNFKIIVDKVTGVNYLYTSSGYGAGLTVLLDEEGNPMIAEVEEKGGQ